MKTSYPQPPFRQYSDLKRWLSTPQKLVAYASKAGCPQPPPNDKGIPSARPVASGGRSLGKRLETNIHQVCKLHSSVAKLNLITAPHATTSLCTMERFKITDSWCQHIPLLHAIANGARLATEFPKPTDARTLDAACPNWESLHYLLTKLLGWQNPGKGLRWWYENDKPVQDSPLLRLVAEIWGRQHALDYFAAWTWSSDCGFHGSASRMAKDSHWGNLDWWRRLLGRGDEDWIDPLHGGYNPLHLGHSDWFGMDQPRADESELYHDLSNRRAVLVVNNFGTWRRDLSAAEMKLPDLGPRSWRLNIFDKQFGHLGCFRQSRDTGLWFQGKHSVHEKGN